MPKRLHLAVSVHDVAPATWQSCQRVLAAVREVADIPVTLLVVPAYWGQCSALAPGFSEAMSDQLARGYELALHGYFHQDLGTPTSGFDWLRRRVYTAGEGEFWDLTESEASERLLLGQRWFHSNGWPLAGFVPPAWLMGTGAWKAVHAFPAIRYVTTFSHIHATQTGVSVHAPCLTFSVRAPWRRALSILWSNLALRRCRATVVRLALHPRDAAYPSVRRAWQRKLETLLDEREAVTKANFVAHVMRQRLGPADARGCSNRTFVASRM